MRYIYLFAVVFLLLLGCSATEKTEETRELMGTEVTITVYSDKGDSDAASSIDDAFNRMESLEAKLSGTDNSSEVSRLNEKKTVRAGEDLLYVINRSLRYSELSEGAFDITVQPILDLYSHTFSELDRPPNASEINETLEYVDYHDISLEGGDITLEENMKITLGGIAKGYIIDEGISVLKREGIRHALVNAGGDIRAIGDKGSDDWHIALRNPDDSDDYITRLDVDNKSVATSGNYERYFDKDKEYHHIINPNTGYSSDGMISVTIITDKAIDADALSTVVFVLGSEEGMSMVEGIGDVEALIINEDREIFRSTGFGRFTSE
ncbi:MAG: FAD:protein FMN transferase [Nanobdellota archaeon]